MNPCRAGCPVGIDIPGFIKKIGERNLRGAYDILTDTNLLPSICGRVCPQESQCEGVCTWGESLEPVPSGASSASWATRPSPRAGSTSPSSSPPASAWASSARAGRMACAADMAKAGCDVTVYEAFHEPGGVLRYGIPTSASPAR